MAAFLPRNETILGVQSLFIHRAIFEYLPFDGQFQPKGEILKTKIPGRRGRGWTLLAVFIVVVEVVVSAGFYGKNYGGLGMLVPNYLLAALGSADEVVESASRGFNRGRQWALYLSGIAIGSVVANVVVILCQILMPFLWYWFYAILIFFGSIFATTSAVDSFWEQWTPTPTAKTT